MYIFYKKNYNLYEMIIFYSINVLIAFKYWFNINLEFIQIIIYKILIY